MAQTFYDLSIVKPLPGEWPALAKGHKPDNQDWFAESGQTFLDGGAGFRFAFSPAAENHYHIGLGVSLLDCEILVKARKTKNPTTEYSNTGLAIAFRITNPGNGTGRPDNCYYLASGTTSTSDDDLRLYSITNGSQADLAAVSSAMPAGDFLDVDIFYRVRLSGSNIKARAWIAGDTEPTDWAIDLTDGDHLSAGDVGVIFHQYGLAGVYYFIGIGTNGDPAPDSYPGGKRVIRGAVQNPNGQNVPGYLVRCYHRASGCLLGETVSDGSGEYEIEVPISEGEPVYCMAIDQLGDTWEAPIADMVLPIAPSV